MVLFFILLSTFSISLFSFVGVFFLFLKQELLNRIILVLVAFSAGALLGGAFLHLLPEAIEESLSLGNVFIFLMAGFCSFFILEQFIHWHHHDMRHQTKPFSYLILISDALHNFIDGLIIAGSFMAAPALGVITSLNVLIHEIPQEIGDFGVLIYGGVKKSRALFLNFISATAAIAGGLIGYFVLEKVGGSEVFLLSFAAGSFIYIASSDLIPEIKHHETIGKSVLHFAVFLSGLLLMWFLKIFTE